MNIGIVIIGRNEGDRLVACLNSVVSDEHCVVYVDSASTDGSVDVARKYGIEVVELDMSIPFSAARARNAGFEHLYRLNPKITYVQFVDGDCVVDEGWLECAVKALNGNLELAVVCGRRRELFPTRSIYNYLCDIEWNTPVGEAKACGGDFMIRASLFADLNGFNEALIAGEEPELCIRVRQSGFKVFRLEKEMTIHDANILHFRQWWKRNVRGGYAFAEGAYMYGNTSERHWVAESKRIWLWAGVLPLFIIIATLFEPVFLSAVILYPIQISRIALRKKEANASHWKYAFFLILGKFPELQGQLYFWFNQLKKAKSTIIEYK